jgi:hypothetical protein
MSITNDIKTLHKCTTLDGFSETIGFPMFQKVFDLRMLFTLSRTEALVYIMWQASMRLDQTLCIIDNNRQQAKNNMAQLVEMLKLVPDTALAKIQGLTRDQMRLSTGSRIISTANGYALRGQSVSKLLMSDSMVPQKAAQIEISALPALAGGPDNRIYFRGTRDET